MNGAALLVKLLSGQGVTTLFGYPGGAIMPVYDALYGSDLNHVLVRHEQAAAIAAIGYARSSGDVGVCLATSGPGATNLITGLADAMMDSVPVVAITGQVAQPLIGTDAFQEIDVLGLSLAVTKHSYLVTNVSQLPQIIAEAFALARSGRPGPVLIDIPKDVQLAAANGGAALVAVDAAEAPEPQALAAATALLQGARKPMLYVGGGVHMAGAEQALADFITTTGMPSVCTLKGLGTISDTTPGYCGLIGMHGNAAANLAVQQCDLLVAVGARFDDRVTGKLDSFAPDAKVIHLDIDPAELGKLRRPHAAIAGDIDAALRALAQPLQLAPWRAEVAILKAHHGWRYDYPGEDIYAPRLLRDLSAALPEDAIISCDVGQHQMWVAQHMRFTSPRCHLTSGGLGTMGFGLPAAIGAQFAWPQRTVVNVTGDGSFMMNVQELATIRRYQLPVKIVLLDNQRLGMVRQWQQLFFDGRFSETILDDNPDFLMLAAACGIPGRTIRLRDEVAPALAELAAAPGPFILHVAIDAEANVWPLVAPGKANHELMSALPAKESA